MSASQKDNLQHRRRGREYAELLNILMNRGIERTTAVISTKVPINFLRDLVELMGVTADKARYHHHALHMTRTGHHDLLPISSLPRASRKTRPLRSGHSGASDSAPRIPHKKRGNVTWFEAHGISPTNTLPIIARSKMNRQLWQAAELCKVLDNRGVRTTSKSLNRVTRLGFLRGLVTRTAPEDPELEEESSAGFVIDDPAPSGSASQAVLLDWRNPASRGKTYSLLAAPWMRPFLAADSSGGSIDGER